MVQKSSYVIDSLPGSTERAGGKGSSLLILRDAGINVPPFYVLPTDTFEAFVKYNGIDRENLRPHSFAWKNIRAPEGLDISIDKAYARIIKNGCVAVRSSANIEDTSGSSNAGTFKTRLFVRRKDIMAAVKDVYASLYEADVSKQSKQNAKMAVVVQKQIYSQKSGVLFITKDYVIVNAIIGQGERLVSGKEIGDTYTVKLRGKKIEQTVSEIRLQKEANLFGKDTVLPLAASYSRKLLRTELDKLVEIGIRIFNIFKSPQDIEWAVSGEDVYILQSRPITSQLPKPLFRIGKAAVPISGGKASGRPWADLSHMPHFPVIVTADEVELRDIPKLKKNAVAGVITKYNGVLSHVGILAREMGIPYITGVMNIEELAKCSRIEMNWDNGAIKATKNGKSIDIRAGLTYKWLHKDIRSITYVSSNRNLLRQEGMFLILYPKDENGEFADETQKGIRLIGDEAIQDAYGLAFRSMYANVDGVKQVFDKLAKAVRTHNAVSLKEAYGSARRHIIEYYLTAREAYTEYTLDKKVEALAKAYVDSTIAYIFYNVVRNATLEYSEYVFGSLISNNAPVSDSELYKQFDDMHGGKLLSFRKAIMDVFDDVDLVEGAGSDESVAEFEEKVAAQLKRRVSKQTYNKIVRDHFG